MRPQAARRPAPLARLLLTLLIFALAVAAAFWGHTVYNRLRYPLKYEETIMMRAQQNGLPPSFLFAVVHTESGFQEDAISEIGASGLMQITEETFQWIGTKLKPQEPLGYDTHIFDSEVNLEYGSFLLGYLYEEYGSLPLALCAYHAGRGSVNDWLSDPQYSEDGVTLKSIPFSDTQWYVDRVQKTRQRYQKIYDMQ